MFAKLFHYSNYKPLKIKNQQLFSLKIHHEKYRKIQLKIQLKILTINLIKKRKGGAAIMKLTILKKKNVKHGNAKRLKK